MIEGIFCLFAFWREGIIVIQLLNMVRSRCSEKYTGWLKSSNYYGTKLGMEHQSSDSRPGPWSTMYHIISRGMSLKSWPKQKRAEILQQDQQKKVTLWRTPNGTVTSLTNKSYELLGSHNHRMISLVFGPLKWDHPDGANGPREQWFKMAAPWGVTVQGCI